MSWRKLLTPVLLVPALAGLFYTFQRMDDTDTGTVEVPSTLPRYTLAIAQFSRYDSYGNPTLGGYADTVDYYDDQSGIAHNLDLELLTAGGSVWRVRAPSAELPARQRRFRLDDSVVATGHWPDSEGELTLKSKYMWIDPDTHLFDTDAPVDLISPGRNGTAVGLRGDWSGRSLQLLHDVKMNYEAPRS
jgi:LPS export ABC transporter protein LptC